MVNGIIIYDKADIERNNAYIKWMIDEAKKYDLNIELVTLNDINFNYIKEKYTFAINRSRSYKLSEKLEDLNIRVFNKSHFCMLGNDKIKAYKFIDNLKINYPIVYKEMKEIDYNKKIIVKPKDGHGGNNIKFLSRNDEILFEENVYQEYIDDYIGDIRFYIVNNKIINSVIRIPKKNDLLSNFSKGGEVRIYNYTESNKKVVNKILNEIEIDYGGIDFLLLKNGEIFFNEFEDAVGSRMLSYLGINNTMDMFLDHVCKEIKKELG
ncbi:ATP-grasp domain-containing protein [Clostridium isatidis]|uniref:ATP-dependent carboxylate-amine ligase n=1 Tax=Clostridium isatidis TaxID=182773 RepID=A0A343JAP2_9CLOT|nr:ATP-grasp domain-containing protein [Clostridium isatidis]ASW42600.1 ATP-dependent carboxylate-amine ligase [Clostridium isatidis]NLZ33491.1 ATP-grasp domain-containing protein [Clostridiales bacterium]